jgi:hypothetical protein
MTQRQLKKYLIIPVIEACNNESLTIITNPENLKHLNPESSEASSAKLNPDTFISLPVIPVLTAAILQPVHRLPMDKPVSSNPMHE